jgi:hypothetical protein
MRQDPQLAQAIVVPAHPARNPPVGAPVPAHPAVPARNPPVGAPVPAHPAVPARNPLVANVDAAALPAVQAGAANFRNNIGAQHPAAINPNSIQIFSASGGSHNSRKRMLAFARGDTLPTAARPNVSGRIDNFDMQVQNQFTQQALQGQAALITANFGAASGFEMSILFTYFVLIVNLGLLTLSTNAALPSQMQDELRKLGMTEMRAMFPAPYESCNICREELQACREGFKNVIFAPCGHPFHPSCIQRLIQHNNMNPTCPTCREPLHAADPYHDLQEAQQYIREQEGLFDEQAQGDQEENFDGDEA